MLIPAWFILQLFIIHIIFQFCTWTKKYNLLTWGIIFIITIILLNKGSNDYRDIRLLIVRSSYGFFYFFTGYLIKLYKNKIYTYLMYPAFLLINYVLVKLLIKFTNFHSYSIVWGNIKSENIIFTIFGTLVIVLMVFQISGYIAHFVADKSKMFILSKNTDIIMFWHLSSFFIINIFFYNIGFFKRDLLSNVYYGYRKDKLWLIYLLGGLTMPLMFNFLISRIQITNIKSFFKYRLLKNNK